VEGVKTRPAWTHPAIVIVFITGCFHVFRGAPIDGVVFLAVAFWLAFAESRWPATALMPGPVEWTHAERRRAHWFVVVAAFLAAVLPRYGDSLALLICLLGIVAIVDASMRPSYEPAKRTMRTWPYAVIGVVAALDELNAFIMQAYAGAGTHEYPALSDVLNPVIGWPPARALLVGLWLAGGVTLLRLMPARKPAHVEVES